MKKNYNLTKIFLAFIFLFQAFFINACGIVNLTNNPTNNLKTFSKKSVPDPLLCSNTENLGVSVSNSKLYSKNIVTITTNIPPKFDEILTVLAQPQIKYKVKIEKINSASFFEKEVTSGCTSFDWDGNDNNGIRLESDEYKVNIYISSDYFYQNYLYFKDFYDRSSTQAAYCNGSIVSIAGNSYAYCDNGVGRELFTADEFAKQNGSTNIELVDIEKEPTPLDPATTRFFEVEDFKKLSDYANQLTIDDSQANELYNQAKLLDVYQKEKISLLARSTINQAKIDAINSKIQSANDSITALQGSVMVQLSDLYNNAYNLANHVNTITESQYITPYPPEEKPQSVGQYYNGIYFFDLDVTSQLLDGVTIYPPDKDDPIQNELKDQWDVSTDRVEVIDPTKIFDASKYLFKEIQTAKDLTNDYISGSFNSSGINNTSDNLEATKTIKDIVSQIYIHRNLLYSKAQNFTDDYYDNYEKNLYSLTELKTYFTLELASAEGKIDKNDTFSLLSLRNKFENDTFFLQGYGERNKFSGRSGRILTFEQMGSIIKKYVNLAFKIIDAPLPYQELRTRLILRYSEEEWKAIKNVDPLATKALVDSTLDMAQATIIIPTTYSDLLVFGKLFKGAKKLSKINLKDIEKLISEVKVIKNEAFSVSERVAKYFSKIRCAPKKGMKINSANIDLRDLINCPEFLQKISVKVINGSKNNTLKNYYKNNNKIYPKSKILENGLSINGKNKFKKAKETFKNFAPNSPERKILDKIESISKNFSKSNGIEIKKLKTKDIYTPNMRPYNVLTDFYVQDIHLSNNTLGKTVMVGGEADYITATQVLYSNSQELRTAFSSPNELQKFFNKIGVTWHHVEDLDTMILVPSEIHAGISHFGASSLIENMGEHLPNWRALVSLGFA